VTLAKRNGFRHIPSQSRSRSTRHRRSRAPGGRGRGEQLERTEAEWSANGDWIEWGGELIWVAGFTSGGAPYGLRVCDFDRADLEAMGLDVTALDDAGLLTNAHSPCDESNDSPRDDDVPF
jgi:hypothetical protein